VLLSLNHISIQQTIPYQGYSVYRQQNRDIEHRKEVSTVSCCLISITDRATGQFVLWKITIYYYCIAGDEHVEDYLRL